MEAAQRTVGSGHCCGRGTGSKLGCSGGAYGARGLDWTGLDCGLWKVDILFLHTIYNGEAADARR